MNASIVCFISSKGGSGKTVTSSALGTFLSALGFKVLLIDTDAATNGMTLLYLEQLLGQRRQKSSPEKSGIGLFEAKEGVTPTTIEIEEKLHLIAASFSMTDTETAGIVHFRAALESVLSSREKYDFVILDAQAGTDTYARSAAGQADQCVIVSEYDPVSAQGIERLKILFSNVLNPSSTWTLFNKVLPEFASVIGEGLSIAHYLAPIPWDADVVRAFARRDLAINMSSPNPYTLAISQVAYVLFPDAVGEAIGKWRELTFQSATKPLENRLRELETVEKKLSQAQERKELFLLRLTIPVYILAVASAAFAGLSAARAFSLPEILNVAANIGVLVPLAIILPITFIRKMRLPFGNKSSKADEMTLQLVRDERIKIETGIAAAESALRFSQDAGFYERHRRAPSSKPT